MLVMVDRLSKYAHFLVQGHPFSTKTVMAVFVKEVVKHYGYPRSIALDHDRIFLSHFWKDKNLFRM